MKPNPYDWWAIPDPVWDANEALAADHDRESERADNTRVWSPHFNFLGCLGEACFAHATGLPQNPSIAIRDGGEDFPGIDVKATRYWQDPLLRFVVTDKLKAPVYCLAAIDLDGRRARLVGYATRRMVRAAPTRSFVPNVLSYVLDEPHLLSADQMICQLYTEARTRGLTAA